MTIFSRNKKTDVRLLDGGLLAVNTTLEDKFHHVQVELTLSPQREIIDAKGFFIRAPFNTCPECLPAMDKLKGIIIGPGMGKMVDEAVGGNHGCAHLVDLVIEAAKGIIQAMDFVLFHPEWDFEDRLQSLKESHRDICYAYSNLDRNPKYLGPRDF